MAELTESRKADSTAQRLAAQTEHLKAVHSGMHSAAKWDLRSEQLKAEHWAEYWDCPMAVMKGGQLEQRLVVNSVPN